jgi:hypothetical protein
MYEAFEKPLYPFENFWKLRIWSNDFVKESLRKSPLPDLDWERVPGVSGKFEYGIPGGPGVYIFVWRSPYPFSSLDGINLSYIVYVGKADSLRHRYNAYVGDRKKTFSVTQKVGSVREGIRNMFKQCGNSLEFFYAEVPYGEIVFVEKTLIELIDPIFNVEHKFERQKIDKDMQSFMLGKLEPPRPAC